MPNDVINTVTVNGTAYGIGGGGHTIKNPAGTAMTQRSNLQFVDLTVSDDSTNDATKVESVHVIQSESELENLPDGLYMLDDDEDTVIDGNLVGYDNTNSDLNAENVQDAIDEVVGLIEHNEFGSYVDISSYGPSNKYTFPSDGYIFISGRSNTTGYIRVYTYGKTSNAINGGISINITGTQQMASLFVRRGMRCYVDTNITGTSIQFISLA